MRQQIAPILSQATAAQVVAAQMPPSKKAKKLSKKPAYSEAGVQNIIEHKPGRKEVEDYLQSKCNELTSHKMSL